MYLNPLWLLINKEINIIEYNLINQKSLTNSPWADCGPSF